MAAKDSKAAKRKATAFKETPKTEENKKTVKEESDYESEQEDLMQGNIDNGQEDSSDDEAEEIYEEGSDDEVLSFESYPSDDENAEERGSDSDFVEEELGSEDEVDSSDDGDSEENDEEADESKPPGELLRIKPEEKEPEQKLSKRQMKKLANKDEYADGDTSDEEDIRNTVGNIPMKWYADYKHLGYDWDAKKILKPEGGDTLDEFLKRMEDPDFWRTVRDPQTGQDIVLSSEDITLIKNIMAGRNPDQNYDNYEPWIEWFTSEVEKLPIRNIPAHKRSFLPSIGEKKKIGKLVHSLKMGWMKTREEQKRIAEANKGPKFYMMWETDTDREKMRRIHDHVVAPKRALPGHAESYNPPAEYLFNKQEMEEWERMAEEPHKRKLHFLPQKYACLRHVPYYERYIKERFIRCLDLYLCPRAKRMKPTIQPEDLIPKLPQPRDLQPYPTMQNLIYKGHEDIIRSISIEPRGEYIVTGSDDKTVKVWEIATARCIKTVKCKDVVRSVAWCPNPKLLLIAAATGQDTILINPKVGDKLLIKKTDDLLIEAPKHDTEENERVKNVISWSVPSQEDYDQGIRIVLHHFKDVKEVTWHGRGDYFATVMPEGANRSVLIHQLSKRKSQIPFSKSKGLIQAVLFHPVKPCIFVATQRHIRIYDLVKQELVKKLISNVKWISSMAIHPKGDNLLVGSYDKKILWFDLDLSTKPYQTLKLHQSAVRNVAYHQRYPLFASASDDRGVIVCHGMVYNDLMQNPLIVPLKRLEYHQRSNDFGVFDVVFHPTQPWLFSTGADHTVRLYT
ncbi:ribosome biogenesis protein BOP1 homolog [Culicoides brevitarsis]|uniref:ribosome biogenesis protein BOP1 homolog n=1 Tax=Culicoides brevitarsis TaxID=469753 RepID=UPI00307C909E